MAKRKLTEWNKAVQQTRKENPKMDFGQVLKTAKKNYHPTKKK